MSTKTAAEELEFAEFARRVDAAVREAAGVDSFTQPGPDRVRWATRGRSATMDAVAPRNVSVTLAGDGEQPVTTWYPCDAALITTVTKRVASYVGEA